MDLSEKLALRIARMTTGMIDDNDVVGLIVGKMDAKASLGVMGSTTLQMLVKVHGSPVILTGILLGEEIGARLRDMGIIDPSCIKECSIEINSVSPGAGQKRAG